MPKHMYFRKNLWVVNHVSGCEVYTHQNNPDLDDPDIGEIKLSKGDNDDNFSVVLNVNKDSKLDEIKFIITERCPSLKVSSENNEITVTDFTVKSFPEFLKAIKDYTLDFNVINKDVKDFYYRFVFNNTSIFPDFLLNLFHSIMFFPIAIGSSLLNSMNSMWQRLLPLDTLILNDISFDFLMSWFKNPGPVETLGENAKLLDKLSFKDEAQKNQFYDQIPKTFICPITMCIMTDPVKIPGSNIFVERVMIEAWLKTNSSDPFTRNPLKKEDLIFDPKLKKEITEFVQKAVKKFDQLNNTENKLSTPEKPHYKQSYNQPILISCNFNMIRKRVDQPLLIDQEEANTDRTSSKLKL